MIAQPWRNRLLFGALALTIVLTVASGGRDKPGDEPALPMHGRAVAKASRPAQPGIELERLQREDAVADKESTAGNAFKAMSWYVPPPPPPPRPPPKPLPPPPPSAPPMPFSFLGRYEDGGARTILLVRGDRIYTVAEGEVIDNTYRVEHLSGGQLELTYLPLNIKQTISAGGT
jgi:hypothetical protein